MSPRAELIIERTRQLARIVWLLLAAMALARLVALLSPAIGPVFRAPDPAGSGGPSAMDVSDVLAEAIRIARQAAP